MEWLHTRETCRLNVLSELAPNETRDNRLKEAFLTSRLLLSVAGSTNSEIVGFPSINTPQGGGRRRRSNITGEQSRLPEELYITGFNTALKFRDPMCGHCTDPLPSA